MLMRLNVLIWLCIALVLRAGTANAAQLGLGLGYVKGDCTVASEDTSRRCFEGGRAEVSLSVLAADHEPAEGKLEKRTEKSEGGSSFSPNFSGGSMRGRGAEVFAVILIAVILIFGIYWFITALLASKTKIGLYYSEDFTTRSDTTYRVQRSGLQMGFYLFESVDLQLAAGVGPASAQVATSVEDDTERYRLRGLASKASFGYVPSEGSGPTFLYEIESTFFNEGSLNRYLENTAKSTELPKVRRSGAWSLGWTVGF